MTIKTFADGSELTGIGLIAAAALCTVTGAAAAYASVKVSNWRYNRFIKKLAINDNR